MMQALLLSLGRAVLADSTWLANPRWRLTADVAVENLHSHVLPDGAEPALEAGVWNLRGRLDSRADAVASLGAATTQPTAASSWPRMLAYVFCAGGGRAFTFDSGLREGLFGRTATVQTANLNGEAVPTSASARSPITAGVFWTVCPRGAPGTDTDAGGTPPAGAPLDVCPVGLKVAADESLPAWLAGTTSRKINTASASERAVAANLSRCGFPLLKAAPVDEHGALRAAETS